MLKRLITGFVIGGVAASGWLFEAVPLQVVLLLLLVFAVDAVVAAAAAAAYYFLIAVGLVTSAALWTVPAESGLLNGAAAVGAFIIYVLAAAFIGATVAAFSENAGGAERRSLKIAYSLISVSLFAYLVSMVWGAPWFALMNIGFGGAQAFVLTILISIAVLIVRNVRNTKTQQVAVALVVAITVASALVTPPKVDVVYDKTFISKAAAAQDVFNASHLISDLRSGHNVGEQAATLFYDDARFDLLKKAVADAGKDRLYAGVYLMGDSRGIRDAALEITPHRVRVARESTLLVPFGQHGVKPGDGGDDNVFICHENYFVRLTLTHADEVVALHNQRWGDRWTMTPAFKASLAQARAAGARKLVFAIVVPRDAQH